MSKHRLILPGVSTKYYWDHELNRHKMQLTINDKNRYSEDYDWDYIYELVCDPKLNLLDQIKYSNQIAMLRKELDSQSQYVHHFIINSKPIIINNTP
jgi:hypothetical protein